MVLPTGYGAGAVVHVVAADVDHVLTAAGVVDQVVAAVVQPVSDPEDQSPEALLVRSRQLIERASTHHVARGRCLRRRGLTR